MGIDGYHMTEISQEEKKHEEKKDEQRKRISAVFRPENCTKGVNTR